MEIINPCQACKDYSSKVEGCIAAMLKGNYNGFTGLGILVDMLEQEKLEGEVVEGLSSICKECSDGKSIYSQEFMEGIRKTYFTVKEGMEKDDGPDAIARVTAAILSDALKKELYRLAEDIVGINKLVEGIIISVKSH